MIKQTIQQINNIHGNLNLKYENIDSLDLIKSKICMEEKCHKSEFRIGCTNCSISFTKNLKYYLKNKLDDLKQQTVDYKSHFKKPCFDCLSSFHGSSFEDGHFNLQKMFEVEQECDSCQRKFTRERSFYHNCNICNASFKNCKLLVHHRTREHNTNKKRHQCAACHLSLSDGALSSHTFKHKPPYKCSYCNKMYASKTNFELHIQAHTGAKPYSCKYCRKQFKLKQSLDYHLIEHIDEKKFKCYLCDRLFTTQSLLNQHKSVHMEKTFPCNYCPKKYTRKRALEAHLFEHTGVKQFKCDLCDKTFAMKFKLKQHKSVHMGKSFQCKYCLKQYKAKWNLDAHLLEHTDGKKIKCDICDRLFARQYLKKHKFIHVTKPLQCKYCPKEFKTQAGLDIHLFEHIGIKKFECDLCDKTFATQTLLKQHKSTHTREPFQCEYCEKQYTTKHSLNVHLFEHTGGKPYKCDLCDKTFAKQFLVNQHKKSSIHIEKLLQCKYCSKQYKTKSNLTLHLFEHTGGKQFKCDMCGKTFAKQFLLNQHKFIHMQKSFQCTICSKFYKTTNDLRRHMKGVHKLQG